MVRGKRKSEIMRELLSVNSILKIVPTLEKDDMYKRLLKGVSVCFGILKSALNGGYVNFGVFSLYNDHALDDALSAFIQLLLVLPQDDLLAYSKLSINYYTLLEAITQSHMTFLSNVQENIFVYIIRTLHDGLNALGKEISI